MSGHVRLEAKLDLPASERLAQDLLALRGEDLVLDASAVDHLGAHAVQTMLVAAATWKAAGHRFAIGPVSDTARSHLATLGLTPAELGGEVAP